MMLIANTLILVGRKCKGSAIPANISRYRWPALAHALEVACPVTIDYVTGIGN